MDTSSSGHQLLIQPAHIYKADDEDCTTHHTRKRTLAIATLISTRTMIRVSTTSNANTVQCLGEGHQGEGRGSKGEGRQKWEVWKGGRGGVKGGGGGVMKGGEGRSDRRRGRGRSEGRSDGKRGRGSGVGRGMGGGGGEVGRRDT